MNNMEKKKPISATEFWQSKFDEKPQNDSEKLAVAMMAEYENYCSQFKTSAPIKEVQMKITVALLRDLEQQVSKGEISYSRMVEILNENIVSPQQESKSKEVAEVLGGYKESLKASLKNAIENQEQENREEFNAGREDAFNYALEMLDKHFC